MSAQSPRKVATISSTRAWQSGLCGALSSKFSFITRKGAAPIFLPIGETCCHCRQSHPRSKEPPSQAARARFSTSSSADIAKHSFASSFRRLPRFRTETELDSQLSQCTMSPSQSPSLVNRLGGQLLAVNHDWLGRQEDVDHACGEEPKVSVCSFEITDASELEETIGEEGEIEKAQGRRRTSPLGLAGVDPSMVGSTLDNDVSRLYESL